MINAVLLALTLLRAVLPELKANPNAETAVESLENAIAELQKVHGSEVTREQLESLRVPQLW